MKAQQNILKPIKLPTYQSGPTECEIYQLFGQYFTT